MSLTRLDCPHAYSYQRVGVTFAYDKSRALAARPPGLPDGPVVTFEQATVQITSLAPRGAKKRFEQFLNEHLDYRAVTLLFRDSGVPEKE
jgi:hypothetical protein